MENDKAISHVSTTDMILDYRAMEQMDRLANMMASGKATVPQHLQGNPADCMAIIMQSAQWKMNPFAVAQKTHVIKGTLGYEAQLINAVVSSSKAIEGAFDYQWYGPWEKIIGNFAEKTGANGKYQVPNWNIADEVGCGIKVFATLRGETKPRVLDLLISQATVRNSTLWASDPKQQLAYLGVKRWARLYAPGVILGVYTSDELEPMEEREVNPAPATSKIVEPNEIEGKPNFTQEMLNDKANDWANAIAKGKKPEVLIKMIQKKYELSEDLINQINNLNKEEVE